MLRLRGASVKQLRSRAEERYDQPISASDIQQVAARESWVDMANLNMQCHGHLVSLMEGCTEGFEIVRTKTEVGIDAWRRLNHKYDLRNPSRNIQLLERLLALSQVGYSDVVGSMERLEQELRVVRQRFGDDVQNLWKSIHMVCIQKICPKILRDHLAVQASSIDSPEKQRLTIEKFLQANVHGSGATPMDVDTLAKTKGGKKGGKGKDKGGKSKKFEGNCFWCGAYGHMMADCQKKAAGMGNRKFPSPREDLIRKQRANAKVAKVRRERRPLTSGQTVRKIHRLMRKPPRMLQVSSLVLSADTRGTVNETGKPGKESRNRHEISGTSYKSGNLCANAVDAELGERIDLTIDSGCAACALLVGVASAVGMQELNRTPQRYIAANAEKIRELGFNDSDTQNFQNDDVHNLKFSVMDKLHKTSGGSVQFCCSWQSDCAAARESRWLLHRRCALEAQETNF